MGKDEFLAPLVGAPVSRVETLTREFYRFEAQGRGWAQYDFPVPVEPPLVPFFYHGATPHKITDNGRSQTFLSSLFDRWRIRKAPIEPDFENHFEYDPTYDERPPYFSDDDSLVDIQLSLQQDQKITGEAAERFLLSLSYSHYPLSFEVIATGETMVVQVVARETDAPHIYAQLQAYFPGGVLTYGLHLLEQRWGEASYSHGAIVEFALSQEFMRPLVITRHFDVDPLIAVCGALSQVADDEIGVLQILFEKARHPWAESIVRSVTDNEGGSFFMDAPELSAQAAQKISRPLYAAVVRVAAKGSSEKRSWALVRSLAATLTQFSAPSHNELIPLSNDDYDQYDQETCLLARQTFRCGMILNSEELAALVHPPSSSVRAERLVRYAKKTKAAPAITLGHSLVLGENHHAGKNNIVSLNPQQRSRHQYVIGASGTGKSTLLINQILQDIQSGQGVGVLDPHGDMIDQIIGLIPESRHNDVILLDPADDEYPIPFNILVAHSDLEKNMLSSDLVAVFQRLSSSWGDQMNSVLGNAILAFLESSQGGSLTDLRRFLVEPDFRRAFLTTVQDPEIVFYWQKEFPLLTGRPQAPLLTRLDMFLRPKLIRAMVGASENKLDFASIINDGKIFLAKLTQGALGEENSYLMGSLLVSKLYQVALTRQEIKQQDRRSFYLYIDEFQNFVTPTMASILSGARKFGLSLVLAHQELQQLAGKSADVAHAVLSNPFTRICFRLGDSDAKKLAEGFASFEAIDLQNLGIGEAIGRVERADYDFNLKTVPPPVVDDEIAERRREQIIALSRSKYAIRREIVASALVESEKPIPEPLPPVETPKAIEVQPQQATPIIVPKPKPQPKAKTLVAATKDSTALGRGGTEHKYLQQLIKQLAEEKGYRATIEKQILEGAGSVDIALEREGRSIACEISVTSTVEYEVHNLQKCLTAGFDAVVLIALEKKTLSKVREKMLAAASEAQQSKLKFLAPDEIPSYIESLEMPAPSGEQTIRGYKVKVSHKQVSDEEKEFRRQAIAHTINRALMRLKSK